jgi:hypothetical protein
MPTPLFKAIGVVRASPIVGAVAFASGTFDLPSSLGVQEGKEELMVRNGRDRLRGTLVPRSAAPMPLEASLTIERALPLHPLK